MSLPALHVEMSLPAAAESRGLRLTPLEPFGLLVEPGDAPATLQSALDGIAASARRHRVVVFRGFAPPQGEAFVSLARTLGDPLLWEFGAVNELVAKDDAQNYLYTRAAVPFHWDGAFAERAPEWILFHCVEAPGSAQGGETLFADTTRVLADAPRDAVDRWRSVEITYATERVVHYGGSATARLVHTHPVTGETVLRYAEPVDARNPVTLDVRGIPAPEVPDLLGDLRRRLYDPRVCFAHRWESGDVVLADNHALVHGRRAFEDAAPRRLRRVNVLERPSCHPVLAKIGHLLRIRRVEFLPAEIPIVAIPLLLCAPFATAGGWAIAEAVAVLVLLFHYGDMVNCLADRDLDRVYKAWLARAVDALGVRSVALQIGASALVAFALTIHLAWTSRQPELLALVVIGLALGAAYSVEPIRLKGRGAWGTTCVGLLLFVGPFALLSQVATGTQRPELVVLSIAYAVLQMGVILVNTAEDYPEDLEAGVRTTIVARGLPRGIRLASVLTVAGGIGVVAWMVATYSAAALPAIRWLALLPLAAGVGFAAGSVVRLDRAISGLTLPEAILTVKRAAVRVPAWIAVTAWSTLLAAAMLR